MTTRVGDLVLLLFAASILESHAQTEQIANHVVHIGIDGLRPDCIELAPGGAPNLLDRFRSQGTWTLTLARTVGRAMSAMGWGATLTSMPPELTGIKSNFWSPAWLDPPNTTYPDSHLEPVMGNRVPFPTVFQVIEEQDPGVETAAFYGWEFFEYMTDLGYPGVVDTVFKCFEANVICDADITDNAVLYLEDLFTRFDVNASYTFIYLSDVDTNGHNAGWCGDNYTAAVDVMDQQVGRILDVIEDAGAVDETVVMLSTDHGGKGRFHGRFQNSDMNIPLFIKGPGIREDYEFSYKVRNMDMVPTAVRVLGLQPSLWWEGTIMTEAFQQGVL